MFRGFAISAFNVFFTRGCPRKVACRIKEAATGLKVKYCMFQKYPNSITLQATLPLDTTGGAQVGCHDPIAPSSWYSSDTQLRILGMIPRMH